MTVRDRVSELRRWEDSGALWAIVALGQDRVTVALLTCDGGEEVDRFESSDPAVLSFVGGRSCSSEG